MPLGKPAVRKAQAAGYGQIALTCEKSVSRAALGELNSISGIEYRFGDISGAAGVHLVHFFNARGMPVGNNRPALR